MHTAEMTYIVKQPLKLLLQYTVCTESLWTHKNKNRAVFKHMDQNGLCCGYTDSNLHESNLVHVKLFR